MMRDCKWREQELAEERHQHEEDCHFEGGTVEAGVRQAWGSYCETWKESAWWDTRPGSSLCQKSWQRSESCKVDGWRRSLLPPLSPLLFRLAGPFLPTVAQVCVPTMLASMRTLECCDDIILIDWSYRQWFRTATRKSSETNLKLAVRLEDLANKWMQDCNTMEKMLIIKEQLLYSLLEHIHIWKPKISRQLANDFAQARRQQGGSRSSGEVKPQPKNSNKVRCHKCKKYGHIARECRAVATPEEGESGVRSTPVERTPTTKTLQVGTLSQRPLPGWMRERIHRPGVRGEQNTESTREPMTWRAGRSCLEWCTLAQNWWGREAIFYY